MWKWHFCFETGSGFGETGSTPHRELPGVPRPRSVFISATIVISSSVKYWLSFFFCYKICVLIRLRHEVIVFFFVKCDVSFLDAPRIVHSSKRQKGSLITLKCEANGNPSPTFTWRNKNERIYEGFNTSWNSSSLIVTQRNNVTLYVCTATNKIGSDSYVFSLPEKGKYSAPIWRKTICGNDYH